MAAVLLKGSTSSAPPWSRPAAMAAQPPVLARHIPSTHHTRILNACTSVFTWKPSPYICSHPERLHLGLKGTQSHTLSFYGKTSTRAYAAAVSGLSEQTLSEDVVKVQDSIPASVEELEQLKATENGNVNDVLQSSSVESGSSQLPDAPPPSQDFSIPQEAPSIPQDNSFSAGSSFTVTDVVPPQPDVSQSSGTEVNQFKSAKDAYEAMLSGSQNSTDSDSNVSISLPDIIAEAKSLISNIQDTIRNSLDNALNSSKNAYDNINDSIVDKLNGLSRGNGTSVELLEEKKNSPIVFDERLSDILTSPFRMGTPANNALKVVVTTVENVTGKAFVAAGHLIADGYFSAKGSLPVDVRLYLDDSEKKVAEISGILKPVLEQIYNIILDAEKSAGIDPENPVIPIFLVFGGSLYLVVLYWQSQYGGYSGDLTPNSALELLKKEGNVILVDIRPEELRESEGIPDLRRQARFKIAPVESLKIEGSIQKLLKNSADAEATITATIIKNLKSVQRNTKVIVMDADGNQSKTIARALKKLGMKLSYRISGGFKAWASEGLRVKQIGSETPLTIIKEETEAILDEVKPTPETTVLVILGSLAGIYALIEWEKTLQLLGVICIGQALYIRLSTYESVEDLKNDIRLLIRPFALATQWVLITAGQLEPNKLQLATSPSTSAVQDRVLQAAAKHGPVASETDQNQQETEPSEDQGQDQDQIPASNDDAITEEQ